MLKVPTTLFTFSTIICHLQSSIVHIDYPPLYQLHCTVHDTFKYITLTTVHYGVMWCITAVLPLPLLSTPRTQRPWSSSLWRTSPMERCHCLLWLQQVGAAEWNNWNLCLSEWLLANSLMLSSSCMNMTCMQSYCCVCWSNSSTDAFGTVVRTGAHVSSEVLQFNVLCIYSVCWTS